VSPRPSVVFSAFRSNADPRLQGWVAFRESVQAGGRTAAARTGELARTGGILRSGEIPRTGELAHPAEVARIGATDRVVDVRDRSRGLATVAMADSGHSGHSGIWRLLASNSRELGRSSSVYGSFTGARAHVLELKDQCDAMVATVVTGPSAGTHGWVVTIGERIVMTAGRWYGAASASREAAAGTIEAFRVAVVAEDARHATEAGRRGSRVLSEEERAQAW
jgi:hypothetical protein